MNQETDNKRRFSRIPYDCNAVIMADGKPWLTQLIDISLNGALVERPEGFNVTIGEKCSLELTLNNSSVIIKMDVAIVAHSAQNCIGFTCKFIDVDSISHLRRLVELNLGDEELLHRELDALGHH